MLKLDSDISQQRALYQVQSILIKDASPFIESPHI